MKKLVMSICVWRSVLGNTNVKAMKNIDSVIAAGDPWKAHKQLAEVIQNKSLPDSAISTYVRRITQQFLDRKAVDILSWLNSPSISKYVTPEITMQVLHLAIDWEWWGIVQGIIVSNLITKTDAQKAIEAIERKLSLENIQLPKNNTWIASEGLNPKTHNMGFKVMTNPEGAKAVKMSKMTYSPISIAEYGEILKKQRITILNIMKESVANKK